MVLGVAVELFVIITEYAHDWRDFKRGTIHSPDKPSILIFGLGFLGAALVAIGVAGEFRIHVNAGKIESDMRSKSRELVGIAQSDAGEANKQAGEANREAAQLRKDAEYLKKQAEDERSARVKLEDTVAWRTFSNNQRGAFADRLKSFRQQLATCSFPSSDMEAFSFSSDIAEALRQAQWQAIPPSPSVMMMREIPGLPTAASPIEKLETGVDVRSTPDAPSVSAAHAVVEELNHLGFDAKFTPSTERPDLRIVWITVQHRPLGAQGEAKLRTDTSKHK